MVNRSIHGEGKKVSPNMQKVTIYLYNPPRKGYSKGAKDFKTTHSFNEIPTLERAMEVINQFAENREGGMLSYALINKAYYNGKLIINKGKVI